MQNEPTISIGMPVYNGEMFIKEALDSLLVQSFRDFELIISDNASTDATAKICREYAEADSRVRYFRQDTNIGAAANFKFVLEQSSGDYFMWAASDDKWSPDWLEQLHRFSGDADVVMTFGRVTHIGLHGEGIGHPANAASFDYENAGSLVRRLRFYLAFEGLGKANAIYSLYSKDMIEPLRAMWAEMIAGTRVHDYTMIFSCLGRGKLRKAGSATLYKRVHSFSEGSLLEGAGSKASTVARVKNALWPFPPGLLRDYLAHASEAEKIILVLLFPLKLYFAYIFRFEQVMRQMRRS